VKKVESRFMKAQDVADTLSVSISSAYRIIKQLNNELNEQGKITFPGKISKRYFEERTYI